MSKIAIIYWSGTGNTEAMADAIEEAVKDAGADVSVFEVGDFSDSLDDYDGLLFGCPAMGDEELEEDEFEPFFAGVEEDLKGRKIGIFGSYEWNDGEWMGIWADRCKAVEADLFRGEGLMAYDNPDDEALEACATYGKEFVEFVG
ncbi:MAG: flavodoxin [Eubacteriales bacterium]|nr:flavodoxin [Eubacteriales bacterium]